MVGERSLRAICSRSITAGMVFNSGERAMLRLRQPTTGGARIISKMAGLAVDHPGVAHVLHRVGDAATSA